jgi:2-aminoadipate transaminase
MSKSLDHSLVTKAPEVEFSELGKGIHRPVIVDIMSQALANPDLLSLAAGFTDNAALPNELVAQLAVEVSSVDRVDAPLQYGTNQGRARLREISGEWMATHPGELCDAFKAEECFVCNGSQQALYLAAQVLCNRGDIVLVEEPSYFVCLEMLKGLGLRPIGIPCNREGAIEAEAFAQLLQTLDAAGERERVKAIYLVTYFSNPSSRSMTFLEKETVARTLLEAGYQIPVIEDAAYRELYFDEPHSCPSVLSLAAFDAFPKLYLGTYTKPFATGLKVGYGYCTHPEWLQKMLGIKGHQDFGSAHFNQAIVERAIETGAYAEHLQRIRPLYAEKATKMQAVLEASGLRKLGWEWTPPVGGLIFWLRGPADMDLRIGSVFCNACIEAGVLYVPGDLCFPSGTPWNCARLSTGALDAGKFKEAVSRFAAVAKRLQSGA